MKILWVREIEQPDFGDSTALGFDGRFYPKRHLAFYKLTRLVEMNKFFIPALSNKTKTNLEN